MATRSLTDTERGLIAIALGIAAERFKSNAATIADKRIAKQFTLQASQATDLAELIGNADDIHIYGDID